MDPYLHDARLLYLVSRILPSGRADDLFRLLWGIENQPDTSGLIQATLP